MWSYLRLGPFVLDHTRDLLDHFVSHEELLGSRRYVSSEEYNLVVESIFENKKQKITKKKYPQLNQPEQCQ